MDKLKKKWEKIQQPKIENLTCRICDKMNKIEKYKKYLSNDIFYAGQLVRYQCPNCDVIFGDLRFLNLSDDEIKQDYLDLYDFYKEGDTTKYFMYIFNKFKYEKNKTYLDYACGKWNNHIKILENRGYNIIGYDPFVKNNINIIGKTFDTVICCNYIEHVIHPYEDINKMLNYVKKRGKLILISPCFELTIEHTHYHTYFFIGKSLFYIQKKLNIKLDRYEKIFFDFTKNNEFTYVVEFTKL